MSSVIQYVVYVAILVAAALPLGSYIAKAMNGEGSFSRPPSSPVRTPYTGYSASIRTRR